MKKSPAGSFMDVEQKKLVLQGEWTNLNAGFIEKGLKRLKKKYKTFPVEAENITRLDTAGAWLIRKYFPGRPVHLTDQQKNIVDLIPDEPEKELKKPERKSGIFSFFVTIGKKSHAAIAFLYGIFCLVGASFIRFLRNFIGLGRFRFPSIVRHIDETGFRALPIIGTMALAMSAVISYQGAKQLQKFGADLFTIDLTVISLLREMAVLVTAIMLAGRSGSAFAAEIGVMKLRGEVDALRVMGLDPVETLVVPRVIALLITLPLLTFYADIVGLAGGGVISSLLLNISWVQYLDRVQSVATPTIFLVGMIKAPVFALLIAFVCTYQGISVSGSAENVGRVTTLAVVQSIFLVLIVDAAFSIIFSEMDI